MVQVRESVVLIPIHPLPGATVLPVQRDLAGLDTLWIGQEGRERLTREPLRTQNGRLMVPPEPGLGIEPGMDRVRQANDLNNSLGSGVRDEVVAMRFSVPGGKYDPKQPSLGRSNAWSENYRVIDWRVSTE